MMMEFCEFRKKIEGDAASFMDGIKRMYSNPHVFFAGYVEDYILDWIVDVVIERSLHYPSMSDDGYDIRPAVEAAFTYVVTRMAMDRADYGFRHEHWEERQKEKRQ